MTRIDAKEDLNGQAFPCTRTRRLLPENKERKLHDIRADSRNSEILGQSSPAVSGKPDMILKLWTAWPLAPLTMLSSALMTMSRPVRGSSRQIGRASCR